MKKKQTKNKKNISMVCYFQPGLLEKRSQNIKHSAKRRGKKENWILPPRLGRHFGMEHAPYSTGFNRIQ